MTDNEWTPGTLYWYEDEVKRLRAEIERLRADVGRLQHEKAEYFEHNIELRAEIERLRTWLGDSEMTVSKLRAALEAINAPFDQTMTGLEIANLQRAIAREALANEQSSGENKR